MMLIPPYNVMQGWPSDRKYEFMHVTPDPGLAAIAGMATGPEPEPEDEENMMDLLIEIEPLAMDDDEIATAVETDGSGEAQTPSAGRVESSCPMPR